MDDALYVALIKGPADRRGVQDRGLHERHVGGRNSRSPVDRSSSTTTSMSARPRARTLCAQMYPAPPVSSRRFLWGI